jgi:threonine dehydrogenase-like Zn-dependent dehydrogenase
MRDGGFAEVVSVPEYAIYPLPSELDFELGSLTEPAAVCVHAARLGALTVGDRVAVLGAGAIGLLSVLVAKAGGASRVVVAARHRHQAEMASRLGATRVVASVAELRADNGPIDLVIETVGGKADTLNEAIHVVRPGGTVVLLGVFSEPPRCNTLGLLAKEVRLVGSLTYGRFGAQADFDRALRLLADHAPLARELITHRFNLEEIDAAFRTAADKQTGCIKVTVTP